MRKAIASATAWASNLLHLTLRATAIAVTQEASQVTI